MPSNRDLFISSLLRKHSTDRLRQPPPGAGCTNSFTSSKAAPQLPASRLPRTAQVLALLLVLLLLLLLLLLLRQQKQQLMINMPFMPESIEDSAHMPLLLAGNRRAVQLHMQRTSPLSLPAAPPSAPGGRPLPRRDRALSSTDADPPGHRHRPLRRP